LEHVDARPGLGHQQTDQTTLREFWLRIKERESGKPFAERLSLFEELISERDLYEYYDKTAREFYCDSLDRLGRPPRKHFSPASTDDGVTSVTATLFKTLFSLEIVMPNGKPLRECYGNEIGQWGSQLFRLARAIGPDQKVGDVFDTDKKLHEFLG
jgi:hypothetical protein